MTVIKKKTYLKYMQKIGSILRHGIRNANYLKQLDMSAFGDFV